MHGDRPTPSAAPDTGSSSQPLARAYAAALAASMERDADIVILGEMAGRMGGTGGSTRGLWSRYPDRVVDVPAADRGVVGFALGLALAGRRPVVELTGAARLYAALEVLAEAATIARTTEFAVPLLVRVPTGGEAGPRIDAPAVAALAEIDGLDVLAPGDAEGVLGALDEALRSVRPTVLLEPRRLWDTPAAGAAPVAAVLRVEGDHAVILTWGTGLDVAREASAALLAEGISAAVLHLVPLLPVNAASLGRAVVARGRLVVAVPNEGGPTDRILRAAVDHAFLSYESPPVVVHAELAPLVDAVRASVTY